MSANTTNKAQLLTIEDFNQLRENPHPESRAAIAGKIGRHFDDHTPDSIEYQIANEIALYLQKDDQQIVRIALADSVRESNGAPKTLILLLAGDLEDQVAIPILKFSPVITDEDLKGILPKISSPKRLVAVAERKFLSVTVSSMLVERHLEEVVVALLSNESAIIDEEIILQIAHKHARSKDVLSRMMKRMPLPANAVNHMVKMQQSGGQENRAPTEIRSFTSLDREMLREDTLSLMFLGEEPDDETCRVMISRLEKQHKVSATLLLLALCLGHERFFINYMSHNTHLPKDRIEELANGGEPSFGLMLNKSGVSPSLYPLMYAVYRDMQDCIEKGMTVGTKEFANKMIESLIKAEGKGINFATTIGKPLSKALKDIFQEK